MNKLFSGTKRPLQLASLLICLHVFLSLRAATALSPTWDEIAYPYSGVRQIATGSLRYYPQNPFLARLLYGLPFVFSRVDTAPSDNPSVDGFNFTYNETRSPRRVLLMERLVPVVFSVFLAVLLYVWSRRVWGEAGALLTLVAYLTVPIFMSRSSLALLEMPMFFFLMLSAWWQKDRPVFSSIAMGGALLCKLTALPALFAFAAAEVHARRYKRAVLWSLGAAAVFCAAYLPWDGGLAAMRSALSDMLVFNKQVPYYFAGANRAHAPGYLSLAALLLKAPLFTLGLGVAGFVSGWRNNEKRAVLTPFLFLAAAYLLFGAVVGSPVSTVQLSPLYLSVVFACGALGAALTSGPRQKKILVLGVLIMSVIDVYRIYPNHLAYFNVVAGGPARGGFWLGDSDQDWGQSLPALGRFAEKNNEAVLFLSYAGAGKPEAHGVTYVDFFSPSLASREHRDVTLPNATEEKRAYFVLGTKVAQSYGDAFAWVTLNRKPKKIIGETFLVYDVSADAAFFNWMSEFYGATNRGEKAAWCAAKADFLSSTDTASRK